MGPLLQKFIIEFLIRMHQDGRGPVDVCRGSRPGPRRGLGYVGKARRSGIGTDEEDEGGQHLCVQEADAGTGFEKGCLKIGSPRRKRCGQVIETRA